MFEMSDRTRAICFVASIFIGVFGLALTPVFANALENSGSGNSISPIDLLDQVN